ncbi:PilW family protein|uniref:PilW family protein n=1 Tax=Noviherbaspirillum sp. L7-7A TaxID=2850560 RepID=UPI001C2C3299|nr:PilW family protein [Noviherbaspirillum sp. L7-7A]MBV0880024.1 PilW family protein [Noviherbaspirillum sp. L7-7A]
MLRLPASRNSRAGFSLAELMVGLALGLLTLLALSQAYLAFHGSRRTTAGTADAQTAAMGALFAIERDLQHAGPGLGDARLLGCGVAIDAGQPVVLAPVRIESGQAGAPDKLVVYAGDLLAPPARLGAALTASSSDIGLSSTQGMRRGDILGLREAGKPCTLARIISVDSALRVSHTILAPQAGLASDYSTLATAFNLGRLSQVSYAIVSGELRRSSGDHAGNNPLVQTLAGNIVSLKAQYGFDTRTMIASVPLVTLWSASMVDADGSGTAGDSGDWQRIAGIRIAVVARSPNREASACDATAANLPGWQAPDSAGTLVRTDISLTHVPDWRCYRYRSYETVVPLRNVIWGRP